MKSSRAFAWIPVLLVLAVCGSYGAIHFGLFNGESKRAKTSTQTTEKLIAATATQDSKAGAVFAKIGETNTEAPDSPQKRVIARFVPIGMSLTGEPDAAFLLELERLKSAMLQGRAEQADKINAAIMQDTAQLRRELVQAVAAKRASDIAIQQAADKDAARDADQFLLVCVAVAALGLYAWTKLSHVSPLTLSRVVNDIRSGVKEEIPAIAALDGATTPFQQANVRLMAWLRNLLAKVRK